MIEAWEKIKYLCTDDMKPILDTVDIDDDVIEYASEHISWIVNPQFIERGGMIRLLHPGEKDEDMDWDRIAANSWTLSDREWDDNQLDRLNDFLPDIDSGLLRNIAFYVYTTWKEKLKEMYPEYHFQVAIVYQVEYDSYWLYFYKCRQEDYIIINNDKNWNNPMLAEII